MLKSSKIIIGVDCVLFVISLVNTLNTKYAFKENIIITVGHFSKMKLNNYKGGYDYSFYIIESKEPFVTGETSSHCLIYESLKSTIKSGDRIEIYTCKNSYFTNAEVVGLMTNNFQYMSLDCVNKQIDSNKIYITLISAIFITSFATGLIVIVSRFKKLRERLKIINIS